MSYYPDCASFTTADLLKRIKETDLVPSRAVLHDKIEGMVLAMEAFGIKNLCELRAELKTIKKAGEFAVKCNLDQEEMILLRREIEGYFPKPCSLSDFKGLDTDKLNKIIESGYKTTQQFYEAFLTSSYGENFSAATKLDKGFLDTLFSLCSLTRIQWTSPLFAGMLFDCGYTAPGKIAAADPDELYRKLDQLNKEKKYFKGTIGPRDIRRLVNAAKYVDQDP